jgi:two-component sensor histidine kinase
VSMPIAAAEEARLAELAAYDVLDTPPEQEFDEIVAMAAEICGVPVALISLVEKERQWFKARVGLDASETPRDVSFCQFAILEADMLVVPDALEDERFASNPLVVGEPHIRFYAGMPLITPRGLALGTLCVIDREPRTLDDRQKRMLQRLARQAMTQFELRRALAASRAALDQVDRHRAAHAEAEERQREIVMEMAHRMKNTLTIVQSIVSQTLRQTSDFGVARSAIEARLAALGRAQDALTKADVGEADVRAVVCAAIAPHCDEGQERFQLEGPPLDLGPRQALGLALGLHELATNAAKYGALSVPDGRVAINWSNDGGTFRFTWREEGGPAPVAPEATGFGSRLVAQIVPAYFEGESTLEFNPEGAIYSLVGLLGTLQKFDALDEPPG